MALNANGDVLPVASTDQNEHFQIIGEYLDELRMLFNDVVTNRSSSKVQREAFENVLEQISEEVRHPRGEAKHPCANIVDELKEFAVELHIDLREEIRELKESHSALTEKITMLENQNSVKRRQRRVSVPVSMSKEGINRDNNITDYVVRVDGIDRTEGIKSENVKSNDTSTGSLQNTEKKRRGRKRKNPNSPEKPRSANAKRILRSREQKMLSDINEF